MKLNKRMLKYKAHRVKVYEDELIADDGRKVYYDFVENRNGSGVLLVDAEGKLIFTGQYRNSVDAYDIEIPAGCMEPGDDEVISDACVVSGKPGDTVAYRRCAIREAEEETGYIPGRLIFINNIIAAVGVFSERTAVYIGTELTRGRVQLDEDEFINVIRLTPDEALSYVYEGKIHDSKSIIAVLAYHNMKGELGKL